MELTSKELNKLFDGAVIHGFTVIARSPDWTIEKIFEYFKMERRKITSIDIGPTYLKKVLDERFK